VRLSLQANTDVFDRIRQWRVGDTSEGTGDVVFGEGEAGFVGVEGLEVTARKVEGAELDGDAGADAEEGGEGAFVEGERAFILEVVAGALEGTERDGGGLEADFDDIEWLADEDLGGSSGGTRDKILAEALEGGIVGAHCVVCSVGMEWRWGMGIRWAKERRRRELVRERRKR